MRIYSDHAIHDTLTSVEKERVVPELPRTIVEAGQWLRSGKITAAELTEAMLAPLPRGAGTARRIQCH